LTKRGAMLRSASRPSSAGPESAQPERVSEEDAVDMTTYDARDKLLPHLVQSDLRSDLLYPDLHGGLPLAGQLQPVEKKLIGFSLGIGLFLLAALVIINHVFPVTP
jgi:hypothetical protein